MSNAEPTSSKKQAKKAQRDAERRKDRGKKRKVEDLDQQPEDDSQKDFLPLEAAQDVESPAPKRAKISANESDKSQRPAHTSGNVQASEGVAGSKKRKRPNPPSATEDTSSKSRFIVFIGNLPYSATDASLQIHFKKLAPFTLRHRIDPKTKKSKGFAFLEFENFDRMKTCLKLYHHSMFDPEAKESSVGEGGEHGQDAGGEHGQDAGGSTKKDPKKDKRIRRINVELTAGGGGKKENRMEKIKAKNVRLEEQRKRRAELERKERAKNEGKRKSAAKSKDGEGQGAAGETGGADSVSGIHPSRLAQVRT